MLAAAVIGSFSWATLGQAYWVASALWYSSLILSILGILISAQQVTVLDLLGAQPRTDSSSERIRFVRRYLSFILREDRSQAAGNDPDRLSGIGAWSVRWKMVFIWQCPVMFMAYSVCAYLAGLTIYVCTPFIRGDPWGAGSKVSRIKPALRLPFSWTRALKNSVGCYCLFDCPDSRWGYICVLQLLGLPLFGLGARGCQCRRDAFADGK